MGIAVVSRHQYSNHQNSSFWPPFWLLPQLKLTPKFSTILTAITHLGTLDTLGTPDTLNPGLTANPTNTPLSTVDTITLPRETPRARLKLIPAFSTKLTDTTHLGTLATLPTPTSCPCCLHPTQGPSPEGRARRIQSPTTRYLHLPYCSNSPRDLHLPYRSNSRDLRLPYCANSRDLHLPHCSSYHHPTSYTSTSIPRIVQGTLQDLEPLCRQERVKNHSALILYLPFYTILPSFCTVSNLSATLFGK